MYPILILRSELVCLVILVFLFFTSRSYNIDKESRSFNRILTFAIIHVIFDIITVLTVNNLNTVPLWVNWSCHVVFYISAILFANETANYMIAICYPRHARKLYILGLLLTLIYIFCLAFLKIEYVADLGTYSSAGPAAVVGYGLAFLFFVVALVICFTHMRTIPTAIKTALIPMMLILMVTEVSQMVCKSILFTGGAITIVTVGFFFSLENPVAVFKKKAMVDALTGVRSRNSFEEDIENFDKSFKADPDSDYIFVFFDLNDLRSVNNRFGHAEGDNYISLISSAISSCMHHCSAVYRIGGDEFLILYYQTDEKTVIKEINDVQDACKKASENLNYTASVAAGYAQSSSSYKSLRDVIKTADYAMYMNKSQSRTETPAKRRKAVGTKLNYTGLTDNIFDVMCASNDRSYPFITNLETNVTRIAPGWNEYFGLENEFFFDFISVWKTRIHPDDYDGYLENIASVMNGHLKYHQYDYMAKRSDGQYVRVSCHGSVYRNSVNGINYFTGFLINHGKDDDTDPLTGLKNFNRILARISTYQDKGKAFTLVKIKLNNIGRINMLYGYGMGDKVIKKISRILTSEVGGTGEVFCHESTNFTILFETCDERTIENCYNRIADKCATKVETENGTIPILISGGAFRNTGKRYEISRMRSALVYALEESQFYQRNHLVFYHELNVETENTDISILARVHADALGNMKYFNLRYQPIIDIATEKTVGAEALLRWQHPKFGEVFPDKFIDFIENDPCYYRLGLAILNQAVKDAKMIQESIPDFKINVNITALQLQNERFIDHVFDILTKHGLSPRSLVLELTERCKQMEDAFLAMKIADFRGRGIQIAYDDLGTGYSTISLLLDIPVDEVKLDKAFVQDLDSRDGYQLFVESLVLGSTSHNNNYTICFEGIENREMFDMVSRYGSFLAQGYYFSKPLLIEDFKEYIKKDLQDT